MTGDPTCEHVLLSDGCNLTTHVTVETALECRVCVCSVCVCVCECVCVSVCECVCSVWNLSRSLMGLCDSKQYRVQQLKEQHTRTIQHSVQDWTDLNCQNRPKQKSVLIVVWMKSANASYKQNKPVLPVW